MRLAVYGLLCNQSFVEALVGHSLVYTDKVIIPGYTKEQSRTGLYFIVRTMDDQVPDCKVIENLTENDIQKLDRFEGIPYGPYVRRPIEAVIGGRYAACEAYVRR